MARGTHNAFQLARCAQRAFDVRAAVRVERGRRVDTAGDVETRGGTPT